MQYQAQLHQFQREMEEQARRYAELQAEQQRREELAEERRAAEQKDLVEQQRKNMEQALAAQAKAQEESTKRIFEQMMFQLSGLQSSPQFHEPRPAAAALPVRLSDSDVLAQISPSGCYMEDYTMSLPTHSVSELTTQAGPSPSSTSTPARGGDPASTSGAVMEPASAASPSGSNHPGAHSEQYAFSTPPLPSNIGPDVDMAQPAVYTEERVTVVESLHSPEAPAVQVEPEYSLGSH